jgi:hypothetical protein
MMFSNIVARWPGSTHDAFIWSNCEPVSQLQQGTGHGSLLLGDSARSWLLTPIRHPADEAERRYNSHHRHQSSRGHSGGGR